MTSLYIQNISPTPPVRSRSCYRAGGRACTETRYSNRLATRNGRGGKLTHQSLLAAEGRTQTPANVGRR